MPKAIRPGSQREIIDPRPHHEVRGEQVGLESLSTRDPLRTRLIEHHGRVWRTVDPLPVPQSFFEQMQDPVERIKFYRENIQDHLAMRVAALWLQFSVAYATGKEFDIGPTTQQYFKAPALRIRSEAGDSIVSYQAAHSSTIPALMIRHHSEHTFTRVLRATHLENVNNSTMGLPTAVNQIDSLLDGKSEGVRRDTLALINHVAMGQLNPVEAMRFFLNNFATKITQYSQGRLTPEKKKILAIYQEKVAEMQSLAEIPFDIQERHPFFDDFINVNFQHDHPENIPILREILFDVKPSIVTESLALEEKIQDIVSELSLTEQPRDKHVTKSCLIYFSPEPIQKILQKCFCLSAHEMEKNADWFEKLHERYNFDPEEFGDAIDEIAQLVEDFQKQEAEYKIMLIKEIGKDLCGMTPEEFCSKIYQTIQRCIQEEREAEFPDEEKILTLRRPRSWCSIENPLFIDIVSEALDVNPEHFRNSFFASRDD
ncbi:Uncharacterized protein PHSC3_001829 [Chlamydiales bacterium STE3]|nr:Uncharacterized protein PHSC3_001829 [Chlamydiales bacterium STE3]